MSLHRQITESMETYYYDNIKGLFDTALGDNFIEESCVGSIDNTKHSIIPTISVIYRLKPTQIRLSFCIKEYEHEDLFNLNVEVINSQNSGSNFYNTTIRNWSETNKLSNFLMKVQEEAISLNKRKITTGESNKDTN